MSTLEIKKHSATHVDLFRCHDTKCGNGAVENYHFITSTEDTRVSLAVESVVKDSVSPSRVIPL